MAEHKEEQFVNEIEALVNRLTGITFRDESDLSTVVLIAMTFMSTFKTLHGLSKKIIVIKSLKKLVELSNFNNKATLILLIDVVTPPLIDTLVKVSKLKINFNPKDSICCISISRK